MEEVLERPAKMFDVAANASETRARRAIEGASRGSRQTADPRRHLTRAQSTDPQIDDDDRFTCMGASSRRGSAGQTRSPEIVLKRPLNVMIVFSSMPLGGAGTQFRNLVYRMDPARFSPRICCLKELGTVGEEVAQRYPASWQLLAHRFDLRVFPRLVSQMKGRIDALITVGTGDKLFWGRIAARAARVPVVLSALQSARCAESVGGWNRALNCWTDAFIAVAPEHGRQLIKQARLPRDKVRVISRGVDTERFRFDAAAPSSLRRELNLPADAPLCGIVAGLRPEKNHDLFLRMAHLVRDRIGNAHFVIVGDGPSAGELRATAARSGLADSVHFLGTRADIPCILAALNVFALTSLDEGHPVSVLEASSVQVPVVATNVGSVSASVKDGVTGFLVEPHDAEQLACRVTQLIEDATLAKALGDAGREEVVAHWSVDRMVRGYEQLIIEIFQRKQSGPTPKLIERTGDSVEFCGATP